MKQADWPLVALAVARHLRDVPDTRLPLEDSAAAARAGRFVARGFRGDVRRLQRDLPAGACGRGRPSGLPAPARPGGEARRGLRHHRPGAHLRHGVPSSCSSPPTCCFVRLPGIDAATFAQVRKAGLLLFAGAVVGPGRALLVRAPRGERHGAGSKRGWGVCRASCARRAGCSWDCWVNSGGRSRCWRAGARCSATAGLDGGAVGVDNPGEHARAAGLRARRGRESRRSSCWAGLWSGRSCRRRARARGRTTRRPRSG